MTITCRFTPKTKAGGPVAEAAIEFHNDCGPLAGFEINSIAIWKKKDGSGFSVTFPSRQYADATGQKKYFNYIQLRRSDGIPDSQKWELPNWIVKQYEEFVGGGRPF